jgi:hypothetical protein
LKAQTHTAALPCLALAVLPASASFVRAVFQDLQHIRFSILGYLG